MCGRSVVVAHRETSPTQNPWNVDGRMRRPRRFEDAAGIGDIPAGRMKIESRSPAVRRNHHESSHRRIAVSRSATAPTSATEASQTSGFVEHALVGAFPNAAFESMTEDAVRRRLDGLESTGEARVGTFGTDRLPESLREFRIRRRVAVVDGDLRRRDEFREPRARRIAPSKETFERRQS
jgi:hypothetical protein